MSLVGGAFIVDATLKDDRQSLTVAEGMADSILTYSEWPLRFATLEECHDSPGLGRPGVMQLDCDGEDYGVIGLGGVDVQGGEETLAHAVSRAVRALTFHDAVELQSTDVLGKLSAEDQARLKTAQVKQLRVSDSYTLEGERFVAVAFVRDPDAAEEDGGRKDSAQNTGTQEDGVQEGRAGADPDNEVEQSLEPDGTAPMVVVQMPVKSASKDTQLEEIGELVRGVSVEDSEDSKENEESAGKSNV